MAVYFMPYLEGEEGARGQTYCAHTCAHTDCASVRKLRESICPICCAGFKADDPYITLERWGVVCLGCAEEAVKRDKLKERGCPYL